MIQRAEALVLEDNPRELGETSGLITGFGLVPFETTSPQQALRWLSARRKPSGAARWSDATTPPRREDLAPPLHSPALAVIDWNMELSGDDDAGTAESVLRKLHSLHPDTLVIVYGAGVGTDLDLEERIAGAHPSAIRHDKRRGRTSLATHISQLLSVSCGDLKVERGSVLHVPSGVHYRHAVALKLMLAYPRPLYFPSNSTAARAGQRFRRWLVEIGSTVRLSSPHDRTSLCRLEVHDEP